MDFTCHFQNITCAYAKDKTFMEVIYEKEICKYYINYQYSPRGQDLIPLQFFHQRNTIKEKAKEEGTISSVGMPDDWADWKDSWESISNTYGLVHDDTDMSSSEELSLFESEKDSPTKDIGDVGQAFGPTAIEMDVVEPQKASTWDSIPDWAKDPDGKWTISYLGTMGALVNTNNVSEPITSWEDLKNSDAKITLGDVLRGASSQMAVLSCAYAMGGDAENLDPAFDYFKELASEGRIDVGDGSVERLNRGEIDVLVTWDYLTLQYRDIVAANNPDLNMECHVMQDGAVQSGYCLVINKYAPHPYSAALTVEYLLSDEGQIERAKGYARPIRDDVVLPDDLKAKMISDDEYTNTIPLTDNDTVTKACSEIANRWEEEIIPLIGEQKLVAA